MKSKSPLHKIRALKGMRSPAMTGLFLHAGRCQASRYHVTRCDPQASSTARIVMLAALHVPLADRCLSGHSFFGRRVVARLRRIWPSSATAMQMPCSSRVSLHLPAHHHAGGS